MERDGENGAPPRASAERAGGGVRLAYLDGMRAAASLYVVLFHAVIGFPRGQLTGPWRLLKRATSFGHEAVAVFIVLSGYCLMLPVVRRGGMTLPRSLGNFIGRRAFRILPPYYMTVALSLVLIASVPALARAGTGTIWDDSLPGLEFGAIASHLLLVHNWVPAWAFQIDGPLWSVATEWQIYFFFPLLLLPIWRRAGLAACLGVALVVGYLPLLLVPASAKNAIPWYLVLFTLGMGAAAIGHVDRPLERTLWERVNWRLVTLALVGAAGVGGWFFGYYWFRAKPLTDLLLGFAAAAFLVNAARDGKLGRTNRVADWLSSRPAVALGHMSYSLYLTHLPVLALCHFTLVGAGFSPLVHALVLLVVGTPLSLAFAWLFYLAVERHFIGQPALPWRAPARAYIPASSGETSRSAGGPSP